jgi:flagellar protein FliS
VATNLRARFTDTMVTTAPPERLLTMCYDRMIRDVTEASQALKSGALPTAHAALVHAQEILAELDRALDTTAWPAGRQLARLYDYLRHCLLQANLRKSADPLRGALQVLEPLAAAWHEAYRGTAVRHG